MERRERGLDIEKATYLSLVAEIESEPADISEGIQKGRLEILLGEQSISSGQGKGRGEAGQSESVAEGLSKPAAMKWLRTSALD